MNPGLTVATAGRVLRQVTEELPEVTAQHRVEADGGLVEDEESGPADQGCGE